MEQYVYLALLIFTLSYPLYKSFEDKIRFHRNWRFLFPGILASAVFFISWDILFTSMGIWEFNPRYILGIFIANLPLEEWLFFLVVPFSCIFIYEVMNYFVKRDVLQPYLLTINILLVGILLVLAAVFHDRLYTVIVCTLLAAFILIHQFIIRSSYLGRFYIAWLVCIIPFLLVNGVLTAMPVVIYDNLEICNFRIYTIPVEDLFYGMLNILQVLTVYEWLRSRHLQKIL
jgi:lycopene cyclase domain-containing protein